MTNIQLNVLFKKMQKDDKKEVLMFHVQSDELPHADELLKLPGSITVLEIFGEEVEKVAAEFANIQRDNKKTVLKFNVNADSKGKIDKFYPYAGRNIDLIIQPSQMTIEEFYEKSDETEDEKEEVAEGQMSLEEVSQ